MGDETAQAGQHPAVIEFTVGVLVRMKWEPTAGKYELDGDMVLTDGGLFADASDGVWNTDVGQWIPLLDAALLAASSRAHRAVEASLLLRGVAE